MLSSRSSPLPLACLLQLAARLEGMSDEELSEHVEELAKAKLERPKRLREAAAKDWQEVDSGVLRFDRPVAEVAALRSLSLPDVIAFFRVRGSCMAGC